MNEEISITLTKRAPIGRISEAYLSDDDDDAPVSLTNTEMVRSRHHEAQTLIKIEEKQFNLLSRLLPGSN